LVFARSLPGLEALCVETSREAGRVCLVIKPEKTKHMRFSASPCQRSVKGATINVVTYEGVVEFIYLGMLINNDNSVEKEIKRRILASNRIYFAAISLFRSRLLSTATKIILYMTLIRPVVSYGAEAWTMMMKEEALLIFQRKIFRITHGPKYENREWKSRTNQELEEMSEGENIVKWIKGQRISWLGRLEITERMERGSRKRSSSAGNEKMEKVGDRKKWNDIVRQAKAHSGLQCQWKKEKKYECSCVYIVMTSR